jgi:multicomponent Na+:H+ antiporter subunit G
VITAPVISQLVGRAAYRSGGFPDDTLVVDELAEHLPADAVVGDEQQPADHDELA